MKAPKMTLTRWLAAAAGVLGSVAAIYAGAAALSFNLDRPAWHSELVELAGITLREILNQKRDELWKVEFAIKRYTDAGKVAPQNLIRRMNILKDQIADLEKRLRG